MGTCDGCVWWFPIGEVTDKPGAWGTCRLHGDGPESVLVSEHPVVWENPAEGLPPAPPYKSEDRRAFTEDAEAYHSELFTRADFGCIDFHTLNRR